MSETEYEYTWIPGMKLFTETTSVLEEMSRLYSEHYGFWSHASPHAGKRIRLSSDRIREWLKCEDTNIALARHNGTLIGYAISVRSNVPDYGTISWVTQFVIHTDHRHRGVGTTLLFSIWGFTDHFSWGLVTASPYAVRALEKATRRRCDAGRVQRNHRKLLAVGSQYAPYIQQEMERNVTKTESRINTEFLVDHSEIAKMLGDVVNGGKPWKLGMLPEGWEWLAFTFNDQDKLALTAEEIEAMLSASDTIVKQAYSRMLLHSPDQKWARHTPKETAFICEQCDVKENSSVLDLGCGLGRHAIEFASRKMSVTAVDYVPGFIQHAKEEAGRAGVDVKFVTADCRTFAGGDEYDLVLCLYDVVGSYADNEQNKAILRNIARHLRRGGNAVISVMNFALTEHLAEQKFTLSSSPERLSDLPASRIMEKTGNIFDPTYYLVDTDTQVVYRREQFASGQSLPVELIVRDRRFRLEEMTKLCEAEGLAVRLIRCVKAGDWDTSLDEHDPKAKEILLICEKV